MRNRSTRPAAGSAEPESAVLVRLAALRIRGFRGIQDCAIELDPVTTIIGEHGATKAAIVDLLEACLGPGSPDLPVFPDSDFPETTGRGARRTLAATFRFVEPFPGAWKDREPDFERLGRRLRDGCLALEITVAADAGTGGRPGRTFLGVSGAARPASVVTRAWSRLREVSPVLVLDSSRRGNAPEGEATRRPTTPEHAEVERLYRKLRATRGRLSTRDLASARAVLADGLHLRTSGSLFLRDDRALVDVVDWQRPSEYDVTDDAVQDVLMRLLRAGLMLEAQRAGRIHPDANPIVVVASPDTGLHPTLAARVWRFLHSVASQVIVTTNAAEVVASSPIRALRRIVVAGGRVRVTRVTPSDFSIDDLRRVIYHVRLRRGSSLLARAWFLVEGETEVWILSEFASILGYSFAAEGVACVEFAQCGLAPLVRLADQLGIGWHVLADGDPAGLAYGNQARTRLAGRRPASHVTLLRSPDIEHVLWDSGYADVIRDSAGQAYRHLTHPKAVIRRALLRASKPLLAIRIIERALQPDSPGVPEPLAVAIRATVALARRSTTRF